MTGSRNDGIVGNPAEPTREDIDNNRSRLLELPVELLKVRNNKQDTTIIGVMLAEEAKDAIRNLSESCKKFHVLFNPKPEERLAKRLLEYVLQASENKVAKVVEMAKWKPELFFVKSTAQDYAMDLKGNRRTIKDYSPIQAIVATSNKEMFAAVKSHLDTYLSTLPKGHQFLQDHIKEKFPNGIDYPPCTDEFNRLIEALAAAIDNDQQLKNNLKNPSATTLQALEAFREYLKPGIVELGYHFNLNNFIKTEELYARYWIPWNRYQLSFFLVKAMAFQQRLCTAWQMQASRMAVRGGLQNYVKRVQQSFQDLFTIRGNKRRHDA